MSNSMQIVVPDIGDFDAVDVIEVLVSVGEQVEAEQPLITLESDKATMEIPAPAAGELTELSVKVGDSISKGDVIGSITSQEQSANEQASGEQPAQEAPSSNSENSAVANSASQLVDIVVPDIGESDAVDVIDVLVAVGDSINKEDSLITLESDKATMDVPAAQAGTIHALSINIGDKVKPGDVIGQIAVQTSQANTSVQSTSAAAKESQAAQTSPTVNSSAKPGSKGYTPPETLPPPVQRAGEQLPHASPGIRRYARELGADLTQIQGSGPKSRILKQDVKQWIKQQLATVDSMQAGTAAGAMTGGMGIPPIASVDFSQFGDIEEVKLSRIKKISGPFLQAAWLNIPHVTHHDEADVTELEAFRQSIKAEAEKQGVRVTMLAFAIKVLVSALKKYPSFNASLSPAADTLILKKYYNIGIAVDTPGGLMVPVIADADKKSIFELAAEMGEISQRARDGKLKPDELKGGCMSISSLGGIGGTAFTPIVNAPEVAILGLTRARMQPVWNGKEFEARLMQPIDLSYDHRVIDGAEAARFVSYLCSAFADLRRLTL